MPLAQDEAASILEREMEKAYAVLRDTDAYRVSAERCPNGKREFQRAIGSAG